MDRKREMRQASLRVFPRQKNRAFCIICRKPVELLGFQASADLFKTDLQDIQYLVDIQDLKAPLHVATQEYGVRRLEPSIGSERSREVVPQLLEQGRAIAGSGADRETEAKVFRWIYDALDGKQQFLEESKEEPRKESTVERFERTLKEIAEVAEEMKGLEPSEHSVRYEGFEGSLTQVNSRSIGEGFDEIADQINDLGLEQELEHTYSTLDFERVELEDAPLNLLATEMSAEEFQHWAQVRLPALDEALESGIKPSIALKLLKARVEKAVQRGTETMAFSLEDLRFASAYLEHQLKQPETRLRHFNERYRDYAQMLDRCQSREEVIQASSKIRIDNASAGLNRQQDGGDRKPTNSPALTSNEMQMLFTEQSPRHFTSEMIVAKLNYAGDAAATKERTEALKKGEIAPSPEAQQLVDNLESRMGRKYLDESLSATKHFLQSLKTPNEELRYKNSFDHNELYRKLPPAERDFVYQQAMEQKNHLEATTRELSEHRGVQTKVVVEELQDVMKAELLALSLSDADPSLIKDRASLILKQYLGDGRNNTVSMETGELAQELSEIVPGLNTRKPQHERAQTGANSSHAVDQNRSNRDLWGAHTR